MHFSLERIELRKQSAQQHMPGGIARWLAADFRTAGQQRQQAQLQGLRPVVVLTDAIQPGGHGT
ncbi:hypothetical protein D3C76_1770330 [compost metagenome]